MTIAHQYNGAHGDECSPFRRWRKQPDSRARRPQAAQPPRHREPASAPALRSAAFQEVWQRYREVIRELDATTAALDSLQRP